MRKSVWTGVIAVFGGWVVSGGGCVWVRAGDHQKRPRRVGTAVEGGAHSYLGRGTLSEAHRAGRAQRLHPHGAPRGGKQEARDGASERRRLASRWTSRPCAATSRRTTKCWHSPNWPPQGRPGRRSATARGRTCSFPSTRRSRTPAEPRASELRCARQTATTWVQSRVENAVKLAEFVDTSRCSSQDWSASPLTDRVGRPLQGGRPRRARQGGDGSPPHVAERPVKVDLAGRSWAKRCLAGTPRLTTWI